MIRRIKLRLFVSLFLIGSIASFAANRGHIERADSLFAKQQYTQAFEMYEELYNQKQASSAMLLKMAFIKDASGDYSKALFFLDQYYELSADRAVVDKIEELATENSLEGYKYSDSAYFMALLNKFRVHVLLVLSSLFALLFVYLYRKSKSGEKAYAAGVILLFISFALNRVVSAKSDNQAVVVYDQTLLRSGPSAGAEPVELITKGHKVKVVSRSEVWTKISWDGKEVFVRNERLKII